MGKIFTIIFILAVAFFVLPILLVMFFPAGFSVYLSGLEILGKASYATYHAFSTGFNSHQATANITSNQTANTTNKTKPKPQPLPPNLLHNS